MKTSNNISVFKDAAYYLTTYFPLTFSFAVCFGLRAYVGLLLSCISIIFSPDIKSKNIMPIFISLLILGCNMQNALGASIICCILLIASSFFSNKLKKIFTSPVVSGIMLAGAMTVTVLFTTDYFGIGATGENVTEMIKSYISLGFHPNWRGVLYGTIVLVITITFPRKFKSFNKFVSAPFIALLFTLILNLFLNPSDMASAIKEIPYSDLSWLKGYLTQRTIISFNLETLLCGIALFIVYFYVVSLNENNTCSDYISCGISNTVSSGLFGIALPYGINQNIQTLPARIIAVIILIVSFITFDEIILRIPVHSCAVIFIVGAWDSVKWSEIKKVFNGVVPVICFTLSAAACLLTDMVIGIIFSSVISVIYYLLNKEKN